MTDPAVPEAEEELVDYEEEEAGADDKKAVAAAAGAGAAAGGAAAGKGAGYVGIHSSGFKDFLLKPELLRAIVDCGFEHPSEGKEKEKRKTADDASVGVAVIFSRLRVLLPSAPVSGSMPCRSRFVALVSGVNAASLGFPADGKGRARGASCPIVGATG